FGAAREKGDSRLLMQSELVGTADVSTFHSFCARVVRENYNVAGVAPDFRILGDVERAALRGAALRGLFDTLYEQRDEAFRLLLARHTARANDAQLMQTVLRVYDRMMGQPDPYRWALTSAEMDGEKYVQKLKTEYGAMRTEELGEAVLLMRRAAEAAAELDEAQYQKDAPVLQRLEEAYACAKDRGAAVTWELYADCAIPAMPRQAREALKERTKELRSEARKHLRAFFGEGETAEFDAVAAEQTAHTREDVRALVRVVSLFDRMYEVQKRDRNALDYEDLEHKALAVLKQDAARHCAKYKYIFVDEYQDTNPVQEEIVKAVSPGGSLFMVGDIKQSIYKFRLADPGIFRQKAKEYSGQAGGELILMNDNFRSAQGVVDAVNFLMDRVMSERLGEVEYSDGEKLVGSRAGGEASVLLCAMDDGEDGEAAEESADAAQADMIARHILSVTEAGQYGYDDIVILMRSRGTLTGEIRRALLERGVPCAVTMEQGRDIPEIELFVNLLRVIENPMQDVPLLSVMRSFLGGLDENDFCEIRLHKKEAAFYEAALCYAAERGGAASDKLNHLFAELELWRGRFACGALMDMVEALREQTDFDTWLAATRGGMEKSRALDELLAVMGDISAEQGNSLYLLLRGLAELKKRDGGYVKLAGSAQAGGHVRIMTIHGSKGLEFPVVYVAGLNKRFNTKDTHDNFLLHGEYGVTACYVDEAERVKQETVEREVVRAKILRENRSEELRMLYVAMTRAQDRLYLTGHVRGKNKQAEKWDMLLGRYEKAACMLDWIMASNSGRQGIAVEYIAAKQGAREAAEFDPEAYCEEAGRRYEPAALIDIPPVLRVPAKVSVSSVKRARGGGVRSFLVPEAEQEEITGARLGTLVHGLMERLVKTSGAAGEAADELFRRRIIREEERDALMGNKWMAEGFLQSGLFQRMKSARRILFEQPFNLCVSARELGYETEETMLVQGILDAAFLENESWVLVDYKTDRVTDETIKSAADGYRVQLALYARALEEITGIPVKERYLYFLRAGCEVAVQA
ncbi:MAG TPA: hypothetical protein DEB31_01120, partial [Clostridiales bacterium]|nr:hypothetical protein [Clostridiales bacterium]